jgi:hypothetical protein
VTSRIDPLFIVFPLLVWSTTLCGQTINGLTAQEKAQGWQLMFDGKTLKGWHPSAPVQGGGRAGAPQPVQPERSLRWAPLRSRVSRHQSDPLRRPAVLTGKSWMNC